MTTWKPRATLILILLVAGVLRLTGIKWDNYDHHHPDERYITWVATTIEWPADWKSALSPTQSTLNPYYWPPEAASKGIEVPQDEQRKFAYGHFPLYLGVAVTRLTERLGPVLAPRLPEQWLLTRDILNGGGLVEYRHLTAVARALTALVDVGTVWLLYLLGRQLYGTAVGLLAAAFLALNVMHIQLAHFFAFDPYTTFFTVAAVYCMVRAAGGRHKLPSQEGTNDVPAARRVNWYLMLAAVFIGLAVGSKFAAILLLLPLVVTVFLSQIKRRERTLLLLVGLGAVVFAITNPFAILDLTCEVITPAFEVGPLSVPALNWGSCFLDNVSTQGAMVRGDLDLAFVRQYSGTLPYLYFVEMQLRWGMGWLLGAVAFVGFAWAIWYAWRNLDLKEWRAGWERVIRRLQPGAIIMLAWTVPFFLVTGSFRVKFMRYLQPLTPFLMLYGAAMLWQWLPEAWKRPVAALVLATTGFYALSFVGLYDQPHPWTAASQWIYANVTPGSLILSEQWDDALPVSMTVEGKYRRRSEYENAPLTWLTGTADRDDLDKLKANLELLADGEYMTLVSNRVYGVVPRLPGRYPLSSQYYQLLFDGSLGYEVVSVHGRFPNLLGFHFKPDSFGWPGLRPPPAVIDYLSSFPGLNSGRADESFTVYDQPLTIIFQNVGRQSAGEMLQLFDVE